MYYLLSPFTYKPVSKEDCEEYIKMEDPISLRCVDSVTINNNNYTELTVVAITEFILFKKAMLNLSPITGKWAYVYIPIIHHTKPENNSE